MTPPIDGAGSRARRVTRRAAQFVRRKVGVDDRDRLVGVGAAALGLSPSLAMLVGQLRADAVGADAETLVVRLFHAEGRSLVRLARLFVDDRDAAEDLVQEAFLRLARRADRIDDIDRAPAYLRSIVLNLARDHNRRGLVSLRHHSTKGRDTDVPVDAEDRVVRSERSLTVLEAVRALPNRQRDCVTLRYFEEQSIDQIAATLGVSANSVKTHLQRGLASLGKRLEEGE